ncbi:MAG: TonB-dependent receptor [Acidobacteria bacterium]|nr:TonB-dependent receptor [Acidobacteriota bacterium]
MAKLLWGMTLACAFIWGQAVTSTITGRLTDPAGAAVPGAKVLVVSEDSGVKYESVSNELGLYRVGSLSPGKYRVEVEASGFQRLVHAGIVVQVSDVVQVDLSLELGNISQTVSVTGSAPQLESQTSSVGQVVERAAIEGMPLPNRAATALIALSPGATVIDTGSGGENIPIFSVAGGRARNQNYTLDGGNATNVVGLAVAQQQNSVPMDAMQEFRVISNNYSAEYGHSTGGVITLSTKSGTNEYHGSVFEYARNDAFDARNFFSSTKPRLRLNQFGGSFGGPIKRDKTHFFASWEDTRQTTGGTSIQTVPGAAMRSGDFSNVRDAAGRVIPIYDPATTVGNVRQIFPGNIIPANRLDPVAKAMTAFWPSPNLAGLITGANNFGANSRPVFNRNIVIGRLDHQFRPSDQLMVRYYINDNQTENDGLWGIPAADPSASIAQGRAQNILAGWTHIFTPTLLNDARFAYLRRANIQLRPASGDAVASKLGLQGVSDAAFPIVGITGVAGLGGNPFRLQTPITDTQFQESVSWFHGAHAFKFGMEYRRGFNQDNTDTSSAGNFSFNPLITGLPGVSNTGIAFASFMLGAANSASTVKPDIIVSHAAYWAAYVQDDWRVSTRLTLNFGLRWEAEVPRTVDGDRMNAFDPTAINPVSGTPGVITFAGRNGVPRSAYNLDANNFGPRFGFAWTADSSGKTVIRGGAGIFYGPTVSNIVATAAALGFSSNVNLIATQPGLNSAVTLRDGFPATTQPTVDQLGAGFGAVPVGKSPNTSVTFFDRNRPTPVSYQYNLNIQRELGGGVVIETGYMANLSHHLTANDLTLNQVPPELMGPGNAQVRRPFPQFTNVLSVNPAIGNSTYHAGFIKAEKRFANGLSVLAHYTFSKFIDDVASFNDYGNPGSYMDAYNRRLDKSLSGNDIPHRALFSTVYDLPLLRGNSLLDRVLGGWKTGVIATFQSGPPFTVFNLADTTNSFPAGALRPDLIGNPVLGSGRGISQWFNTAAFRAPATNTFGNSPRSVLRGPGIANIDLSLLKNFKIERAKAEFRGEFYNFLNHANFGLPGATLGGPGFGVINSARAARAVQLGLRVAF